MPIPWFGNSPETGWDLINLVGYRALMTYYMPFFYMAWIEVWLYNPNKFRKLTDAFYLLKHETKIIFNRLVRTAFSIPVLMQIHMLPLKVCVFSDKRDQTPVKISSSGDPASQNARFLKILHPEPSKLLAEVVQPHTLLQPGLRISLALSHHTETKQKIIQLALPGLDHYPNFLRVPQRCCCPWEAVWGHPPSQKVRWVILVVLMFHHFRLLVTSCYWSWSGKKVSQRD